MSKNISKVIGIFLILLVFCGRYFPVFADLQSTTYSIKEYDFGSGGKLSNTSTTYSLYGNTGQFDGLSLNSTTYTALPGLTYGLTSNVPPAPSFSNPGSSSNSLSLTLNTGSNPSDTVFAIAISPDAFGSTTKYVQADDTVGNNPVWQTNTVWGASGFTVIGLSSGTTYTVKVSAKQGIYAQSGYGPTAAATTVATTTFSYSINSNSLTFPNLNPGSVQTSTSTVTVT
ncbi:MAG: hypothetical protein KGJ07_09650, partial [Patescibacteria group bacterium]|nr:hypothetical protein [Patescibacteria group bacterium]